jgi:hypothetical protein
MSDMQTSNPSARAKVQLFQLPDVPRAGQQSSRTMAVPSFSGAGSPLYIPRRVAVTAFLKSKNHALHRHRNVCNFVSRLDLLCQA